MINARAIAATRVNISKLRKRPQQLLALHGGAIEAGAWREPGKWIDHISGEEVYRRLITNGTCRQKVSRHPVQGISLNSQIVTTVAYVCRFDQPLSG